MIQRVRRRIRLPKSGSLTDVVQISGVVNDFFFLDIGLLCAYITGTARKGQIQERRIQMAAKKSKGKSTKHLRKAKHLEPTKTLSRASKTDYME
jgi:hypothetical protein